MAEQPSSPLSLAQIPRRIVTPRLDITLLRLEDAPDISRGLQESWPEMHHWVAWADTPESIGLPKQHEAVSRNILQFNKGEAYFGVSRLRTTGELGPQVTLYNMDLDNQCGECGYWTPTKLTGSGLTTEGMAAVLKLGTSCYGLKEIFARHGAGNTASQRVLNKLGFVFDHVVKDGSQRGSGEHLDAYVYRLTASQTFPSDALFYS